MGSKCLSIVTVVSCNRVKGKAVKLREVLKNYCKICHAQGVVKVFLSDITKEQTMRSLLTEQDEASVFLTNIDMF